MTTRSPKDTGIYQDQYGYRVVAIYRTQRDERRYPPDADRATMRAWRDRRKLELRETAPTKIRQGTLRAAVAEYLQIAPITAGCRVRRTQQLAFWIAQPAAIGAPVYPVAAVVDARATGKLLAPPGRSLGDVAVQELEPKRLREILAIAFAAPDGDPAGHASTSNAYRTALHHLFTILDRDVRPTPPTPLDSIAVRPGRRSRRSGRDMRFVVAILEHAPSPHGIYRKQRANLLRLGVLAWTHITPDQLKGVYPPTDFHDVPDATRDEIRAGAITLTKRPRLKGLKPGQEPAPTEEIYLNPWAVAAWRAFAAEPAVWGDYNVSSVNAKFRSAAARAHADLLARGIDAALDQMTLYHLKHSFASAAQAATGGAVDQQMRIRQDPGLQRALDHAANSRSTAVYTQSANAVIMRRVNLETTLYLERLLATPLDMPAALRIVR